MTTLANALRGLRPGVDFADRDGTLASVRWDDPPEGFTPPTEQEVELWVARAAKRAAADAAFAAAIAAGVSHGGKVFQLDDASQSRITALTSRAAFSLLGVPGIAWPAESVYIAADNEQVSFSASQFMAFAQAAADRVTGVRINYRNLKDAIANAASLEALEAIDVGEGWEGQ